MGGKIDLSIIGENEAIDINKGRTQVTLERGNRSGWRGLQSGLGARLLINVIVFHLLGTHE